MTTLSLIPLTFVLASLGWLLFRGLNIWWDFASGLHGSKAPSPTRVTGWVTFLLLTIGLISLVLLASCLLSIALATLIA